MLWLENIKLQTFGGQQVSADEEEGVREVGRKHCDFRVESLVYLFRKGIVVVCSEVSVVKFLSEYEHRHTKYLEYAE